MEGVCRDHGRVLGRPRFVTRVRVLKTKVPEFPKLPLSVRSGRPAAKGEAGEI